MHAGVLRRRRRATVPRKVKKKKRQYQLLDPNQRAAKRGKRVNY